jgi:HKD family nuclease
MRFSPALPLSSRDADPPFAPPMQRNIKKQVSETVELSLNKPSKEMWDKILSTFKEALAKAEEAYIRKATSSFPP